MSPDKKPPIDWEAVEREYRAGQLSVAEIARQHKISHPAILKRAKRDGWQRNLAERVKEAVTARIVTDGVTGRTAAETVELAAERGVQIVRGHKGLIGRGRKIVDSLFDELEEGTENRQEIGGEIEVETGDDNSPRRRNMMMKAIALPSRASTLVNLSTALKTFIGLERQAFALGTEGEGNEGASTDHCIKVQFVSPAPK